MRQSQLTNRDSSEERLSFLKNAKEAAFIAVDTETTGKDIRDGTGIAMGVSVAYKDQRQLTTYSMYTAFNHMADNSPVAEQEAVKDLIENHNGIIFHNAKFDIVSLSTIGIKVPSTYYCTMMLAHRLNEEVQSHGLDWLAKNWLEIEGKNRSKVMQDIIDTLGWGFLNVETIETYAAHDAYLTLMLFEHMLPALLAEDILGSIWEADKKFIASVSSMETRGIMIDKDLIQQEIHKGKTRMHEIATQLTYNPSSPKHLEELLLDKMGLPVVKTTPAGKPSFDKGAMEEYESILADLGDDPRASLILEYRGWQKTVSASYEPFLKLASSDGRLRPNYKLHGTVTGRMSCEKPNLQQIPRISDKPWNGNLKQAFIATPGYTLFEADYSQLELRLATAYAGITSLTNAFAEDRDVFTEMSQSLGMSRHDTKTLTYTIQYGGGINRISNVFKVSAAEATLIRDNFFNRYPEFRRITKEANDSAKRNGYVKLWSGRRRHFTDPAKDSFKAFNSAIQGGSADIVARIINRLTSEVADDRCYFLLQVHDSVVFEVQQGYESEYLIKIQNIMEDVELICPVATGVKFAVAINEWGKK